MSPDMIPAEVESTTNVIQAIGPDDYNIEEHPLRLLETLAKKFNIKSFTLRTYEECEYGGGFRDIASYRVPAEKIVERGLKLMAEAKEDGHDLVVDSLVRIENGIAGTKGDAMHLGFVDFLVKAEDIDIDTLVNNLSEDPETKTDFHSMTGVDPETGLAFFRSGRSYHAYVTQTLFSEEEMRIFLATLLVIKPLHQADVVDSRWVGRRLLAGSGALRLTKTSARYLAFPQRVYTAPPF